MTFFQNIAIVWYRMFDSTGFLFDFASSFKLRIMRFFFYASFPSFIYIGMFLLGSMINLNVLFSEDEILITLAQTIGRYTVYSATLIAALMVTYESVLNVDMEEKYHQYLQHISLLKREKRQWWRLRNMYFAYRILLYTFTFMLVVNIAQMAMLSMPLPYQTDMTEFKEEYKTLLNYVISIYLIILVIVEYFARRNRRKRDEN